ncbi:MAG: hypothetical protein LC785_07285 [Acidobacteria bacterium]|nr:hypothetical protein [Acidobacteriota bacterium]MCA1641741.1 hypothetical protein [Acidobacteriota bacterium]
MSTNEIAAQPPGAPPVAKEAPTEQQASRDGAPKRFAKGQTVCNEKNAKGKLCNGHLKQTSPANENALEHLRGEDVPYKCQTCGTLYLGPPLGHLRDPRKQMRFVEKELVEILMAAGGTLPAFKKNASGAFVPASDAAHAPAAKPAATPAAGAKPAAAPAAKPAEPEETPEQKRERKKAEAAARRANAVPIPGASGPPPEGETPEQKLARLRAVVEEAKRRKEAAAAESPALPSDIPPAAATTSPTSGTDSSPAADAHRPAAEAQAATGAASAAPLSPAAATASPAAGAETEADLAPDASTELTPGAPRAEAKAKSGSHSGFKVPAELLPVAGETHEQKIERLRRTVEEAKRAAGKL